VNIIDNKNRILIISRRHRTILLYIGTRKLDNDNIIDSIIPKDNDKTGGLPKEIEIFVGAKVMLIEPT